MDLGAPILDVEMAIIVNKEDNNTSNATNSTESDNEAEPEKKSIISGGKLVAEGYEEKVLYIPKNESSDLNVD